MLGLLGSYQAGPVPNSRIRTYTCTDCYSRDRCISQGIYAFSLLYTVRHIVWRTWCFVTACHGPAHVCSQVLSLCSEPLIETYYKQGKIKVVSSGNSMPVST